jgi:NADPH:quinone reductase-like Zn-dependent oxidoreductase
MAAQTLKGDDNMKAVQLIGYGDAVKNLELRDVPEPPPPGKGEVLVGMEYARSISMILWFLGACFRGGRRYPQRLAMKEPVSF